MRECTSPVQPKASRQPVGKETAVLALHTTCATVLLQLAVEVAPVSSLIVRLVRGADSFQVLRPSFQVTTVLVEGTAPGSSKRCCKNDW